MLRKGEDKMGLHRFKPVPSGRMGTLSTLASVREAALLEFGCMGHMLYGRVALNRAGIPDGCKLYSTHLDEADISLGDIKRIRLAIADIIARDKPKVIFLLPSSIPEMIGTDLPAICQELQEEFDDTRLLPFGAGGFNVGQHRGVQETLLTLAKTLPRNTDPTPVPTFNLIGSCGDLFRFQADAGELLRLMEGAFGMKPLCVMTSDTTVQQLEEMGGAHINLVMRREGEPAAKHLQKKFGTPYLFSRPYGIDGTGNWLEQVAETVKLLPDRSFIKAEREKMKKLISPFIPMLTHAIRSNPDNVRLFLGGHADVVKGILAYACGELGMPQGVCWCDSPDMADGELAYLTEQEWTGKLPPRNKGFLMASGEVLSWAGRGEDMQISNPDVKWHLNPYEPPFVGFRGVPHLASLWANEVLRRYGRD